MSIQHPTEAQGYLTTCSNTLPGVGGGGPHPQAVHHHLVLCRMVVVVVAVAVVVRLVGDAAGGGGYDCDVVVAMTRVVMHAPALQA